MNIALQTNKIWRNTFFNWIDEDEILQQSYIRARQRLGHALYDRILDEVNEIDSVESAMIAKAKIDPLKWLAGKANQQYNDKYTGEQNAPVLVDAGALSQEEREVNIGKLVEKLTLLKQSYQRQNRKLNSGNSDNTVDWFITNNAITLRVETKKIEDNATIRQIDWEYLNIRVNKSILIGLNSKIGIIEEGNEQQIK